MSAASKTTRRSRTKTSTKKAARKTSRAKSAASKTTRKTAARSTATKAKATKAKASKAKTAKPAAKPAKRLPRTATRPRLAALMERLDRAFGPIEPPEDLATVLERALYLVLREQGSDMIARRALEALRRDFVDWNEVRVSRPAELSRLMSGTSKATVLRRFEQRARRVKELIDQIYNDRNEPSLEFVLDERPKGQLEYLEDLDDLGMHNAYALVQWLADDEKLVLVSSEMAKACRSLGITDSASVAKVRKDLTALANGAQLVSIQAHLNQVGNLEPAEWPSSIKEFVV